MSKHRNYCFTLNNYTEDEYKSILQCGYKYIVIGKEVGESGTPHLQGYVEFANPRAMTAIKKFMPRAHLEGRKGTAVQASDYCKKDGNFFEDGTLSKQGERKDLDDIKDLIISGTTTVDDLALEAPIIVHQYGRTLDRMEDICMRKKYRTEMTTGIWYFGETGVGKSHRAFQDYSPVTHYRTPKDNNWWDGYRQQPTVIVNEFRGHIPFGFLLEMVDKWPFDVPRRGREPMPFTSKHVIVTSSLPPEEVYRNMGNDSLAQLYRRFEVIRILADGTEQKWSGGNTIPLTFQQSLL